MRANRTLEIGTGLFVLLGFAALIFLTTQLPSSGLKLSGTKAGYRVSAEFDNVGELRSGAPVTMSGVRIGEVEKIGIDPQDYRARVTMRIDPAYNMIPDDSDASIDTEGLLGGQYIAIGPGGSEMYLQNGSTIQFTQSAIVLENLVNKLFANFASKGSESSSASSSGNAGGSANENGGTGGANSGGGRAAGTAHAHNAGKAKHPPQGQ